MLNKLDMTCRTTINNQ